MQVNLITPTRGHPCTPMNSRRCATEQDRLIWVAIPRGDAAATTALTDMVGFHPMPTP